MVDILCFDKDKNYNVLTVYEDYYGLTTALYLISKFVNIKVYKVCKYI